MSRLSSPLVLFVGSAGPETGFGHLVRLGRLADALGVRRELVLGGGDHAHDVALGFGWTIHRGGDPLAALLPDLVVVDDPSPIRTAAWIARAQRFGVPVATVADASRHRLCADLTIDGSIATPRVESSSRLAGPAFALLDPRLAALRGRARRPNHVLVALGGGSHVRRLGGEVARAVVTAYPDVTVDIAAGFSASAAPNSPRLPARCRWIYASDGLASALSECAVAVVAGGVTLHEACALGCPSVAVAVVPAQRPIVKAAAAVGAVRIADSPASIARAVAALLEDPRQARALGARAGLVVDGKGMARVVKRLRSLASAASERRWHHAA